MSFTMKNTLLLSVLILFFIPVFSQPIPSYVPTNGLVVWYPFNGNANDESGNGNDGTVNGATLTTDRLGNQNSAFLFDGISNYIQNNSAISSDSPFSISAWIYAPSSGDRPVCTFGYSQNGLDQLSFGLYPSSNHLTCHTSGANDVSSTIALIDTLQWCHIVLTHTTGYDTSSFRFYLNGIEYHPDRKQGGNVPFPTGTIGAIGGGRSLTFFEGKIDDVGIWDRSLNQQEVTNLYNSFIYIPCSSPPFPSNLATGLVGYWPFCGNAEDQSGNSNNGIVNGANLTTDRFGNDNSAYQFDGTSAEILVNDTPSLQTPNAVTLNAWVKFNQGGTLAPRLISKGWNPNGIEVHATSDTLHSISFGGTYNGTGYGPTSFTNCTIGQWYMITAVDDGNTKVIYVNGQPEDSLNHQYGAIPINSFPLVFGKNSQTNSDYLSGSLDDIGMWNRALSQNEISQLYNTGLCFQTITVTDTLIINANLTNFNPVTYQNTIKVYPNPTNDHLIMDFGSNYTTLSGYSIRIDNTLGQTVYSNQINQQSVTVDINSWTGNGIYLIYLLNTAGIPVDVRKIVIQ